jgi:hypothetical protein
MQLLSSIIAKPGSLDRWLKCLFMSSLACGLAGCVSYELRRPSGPGGPEMHAEERGFVAGGTGFESQDIATVADRMAREILTTPEIANAKGVPRIALLPVKNETRFPINKDIFLERILSLLNEKSAGKVRFLSRDRLAEVERDRKQSGLAPANNDLRLTALKSADFMLTGKLMGATARTTAGAIDYVLYSFTLIDPNTSDIVCQKSHEIKKQGLEDAAYR